MTIPCTNQPHPIPKLLVLSPKNGCAIGFYPTSSTSLLESPLPKVWCNFFPQKTGSRNRKRFQRTQWPIVPQEAVRTSPRCWQRFAAVSTPAQWGPGGPDGPGALGAPAAAAKVPRATRAWGDWWSPWSPPNWEMVVAVQDLDSDMIIDVQCWCGIYKKLRNKCEIENLLSRKMVIMRLCGAETTYRTTNNKLIGERRANETRTTIGI